jgi:glycine/D-amino acid oxidase-like deaminating enzyme
MKPYASYSYWLETCGDDLTPRAALEGPIEADVAILGAGYTGLWTAYYLLKRRPGLRVVILDKEIAGFGASGRNGGWCSGKLHLGIDNMIGRFGVDAARRVQEALFDTVDEIGRVCAAEGIDAHYVKSGALFVARFPYQVPEMREYASLFGHIGFGERVKVLSADELARRVRVRGALGAYWSPDYASLHPGRLVRGLARAVERLGGRLFERTPVTDVVPGPPAVLRTPAGDVRASAVVLAGEAYLCRLPRRRRTLLPIYSLIVLTEPLSESQWDGIGWRQRECLCSFRLTVDYLTRTADGRILFGGRGAPYHFASGIADAYDHDAPTHALLRAMTREWFPGLEDVRFSHAWGGPIAVPRDWTPAFTWDPRSGVATASGYTGSGVAGSNLAGRTLADLITGGDTPLTRLPFVNHRSPLWEPEPLRWLAVRYIQKAYARLDERGERTGRAPDGTSLAERFAGH